MSSLDQISADLELLDSKRESILKTLQSYHYPFITPQWEEYREISYSIKSSFENFLKDLESKEREINDRFKELEIRGNGGRRENLGLGMTGCSSGEKLLTFLMDHENELEKMAVDVHSILIISADPTKLVLNAIIKGFTLETENSVVKRCIVVLLEQLMRVEPISGKRLRKRATKIAKKWKIQLERGGQDDLEVLGFLMFLGVYKLVCEFDLIEVRNLFESVSQHKQATDLRQLLCLVDKSPGGSSSQVQMKREEQELDEILPSQVKLEQYMASPSLNHWPELKSFCFNMDGKGLLLFLCQHLQAHDSMRDAISDALGLASDPAKLVLDVLPAFLLRPNEYIAGLCLPQVRKCCILLLEQLATISPVIETRLSEEALRFGVEWKEKVGQNYPTAVSVYGLLQFIATYGLVSSFDGYELLDILVRASEHKPSPGLCLALGLADKAPVLIDNLLKKPMILEAMEYICAFELFLEFPPARLLKGHWSYHMKRLTKGKKSHLSQKQILNEEVKITKDILKCIIDHKLEMHCSPEELKVYIMELEKQKAAGTYSPEHRRAVWF